MEFLTDPSNWWLEPFTANEFMQNALMAGLLAVLATSVVGTWVVLRGMSFLGDALAHGVLPGIALAFVFGFSPTIGALAAALAMVAGYQRDSGQFTATRGHFNRSAFRRILGVGSCNHVEPVRFLRG